MFTYMDNQVKSARRVLDIVELFASSDRALALRDVVKILGLPKSSTHMLIGTLEHRGYIVRDEDERFRLALSLREGGWVGGVPGQIYRTAQPWLDRLLDAHEESVVLAAPTPGLDIRILSHRISPLAIRYDVSRTPVVPGYCTAMGHAVMSFLPEDDVRRYLEGTDRVALTDKTLTDVDDIIARIAQDRAQGFALNVDERFEGASGVAVAICDPHGHPHAALNIVTVTPRFRRKQKAIVAALLEAARGIESEVFKEKSRSEEISA